jgi:hypothetical protein
MIGTIPLSLVHISIENECNVMPHDLLAAKTESCLVVESKFSCHKIAKLVLREYKKCGIGKTRTLDKLAIFTTFSRAISVVSARL